MLGLSSIELRADCFNITIFTMAESKHDKLRIGTLTNLSFNSRKQSMSVKLIFVMIQKTCNIYKRQRTISDFESLGLVSCCGLTTVMVSSFSRGIFSCTGTNCLRRRILAHILYTRYTRFFLFSNPISMLNT